jgi:DNA repair exonuclease SbcCD nuclease subunit
MQLSELERAADELIKRGGNLMVFAGDLFHVRGSVDPEVFNPVHAALLAIIAKGVSIMAIPGNHDLNGKETTKLGNSFQTMSSIEGISVVTECDIPYGAHDPKIVMIPWHSTLDALRQTVQDFKGTDHGTGAPRSEIDLIIHAGIDGVLSGVPAGGLTSEEIASWGFKRAFAGHYHNHKDFGNGVVSIGATTHQNWGDIGTKAGFVFVYDDHIEWQASHAPEFVEISSETPEEEIPLVVDGNYVRIRAMKLTDGEIKTFRKSLEEMGARGVTFQVAREAVAARVGAVAGKATTLDESVDKFIDTLTEIDTVAVKAQCVEVLTHIRSVAA